MNTHTSVSPHFQTMSNVEVNRRIALHIGMHVPTHDWIGQIGDVLVDESSDNRPMFPDFCRDSQRMSLFRDLYGIDVKPTDNGGFKAFKVAEKSICSVGETAHRAVLNVVLMIDHLRREAL